MSVCFTKSPVYKTGMSKLCVIALFMQDSRKIAKYCKVIVTLNTQLPTAKYITNGHWVISTLEKLHFVKICGDGPDTLATDLTVQPPMQILSLEKSCSAVISSLTLPPYYHKESKYNVTNLLATCMASYNVSAVELWKPVHSQFDNLQNISIPEKLKDLDDVPINKLVEELESVHTVNPMFDIWGLPTWVYILIGMGCALILGIILFAYCKSKKRWSGKLWCRSKSSEKRDEAGFLVWRW